MVPMQDRMEEWKKSLVILDKDHAKGQIPNTLVLDLKKSCTKTQFSKISFSRNISEVSCLVI